MSSSISLSHPKRGRWPAVWTTGFALFAMFFGAGNLVFPLLIGKDAGADIPYAILGLTFSAVAFPFIGLIAMLLYQGDLRLFLSRVGKGPALVLLLVLQLSMGPLAILPRLVTLMHASAKPFWPNLSLSLFSALLCILLFALAFQREKIVGLLGKVLTPFKLGTLAALVIMGLVSAPKILPAGSGVWHNLVEGLKGGYQTMDLLGALLYATLVLPYLRRGTEGLNDIDAEKEVRWRMVGASLVSVGLLISAYVGLCLVAAFNGPSLPHLAPEDLLQAIAVRTLGDSGSLLASCGIFLACLTTALSLTVVFSEFLRTEIAKDKIPFALALIVTLLATGFMATLGFGGLMKMIGPAMQILYPILVALCLINIWKSRCRSN